MNCKFLDTQFCIYNEADMRKGDGHKHIGTVKKGSDLVPIVMYAHTESRVQSRMRQIEKYDNRFVFNLDKILPLLKRGLVRHGAKYMYSHVEGTEDPAFVSRFYYLVKTPTNYYKVEIGFLVRYSLLIGSYKSAHKFYKDLMTTYNLKANYSRIFTIETMACFYSEGEDNFKTFSNYSNSVSSETKLGEVEMSDDESYQMFNYVRSLSIIK